MRVLGEILIENVRKKVSREDADLYRPESLGGSPFYFMLVVAFSTSLDNGTNGSFDAPHACTLQYYEQPCRRHVGDSLCGDATPTKRS